jgi:hypothetical protein
MPESVPVFIEVRNPFPNLMFARKKKRLRVVNTTKIFKRMCVGGIPSVQANN